MAKYLQVYPELHGPARHCTNRRAADQLRAGAASAAGSLLVYL